MKRRRRRILPRADINVTPFIDILLVLLVIFMTISPTIPTGLASPHKASGRTMSKQQTWLTRSMNVSRLVWKLQVVKS